MVAGYVVVCCGSSEYTRRVARPIVHHLVVPLGNQFALSGHCLRESYGEVLGRGVCMHVANITWEVTVSEITEAFFCHVWAKQTEVGEKKIPQRFILNSEALPELGTP